MGWSHVKVGLELVSWPLVFRAGGEGLKSYYRTTVSNCTRNTAEKGKVAHDCCLMRLLQVLGGVAPTPLPGMLRNNAIYSTRMNVVYKTTAAPATT